MSNLACQPLPNNCAISQRLRYNCYHTAIDVLAQDLAFERYLRDYKLCGLLVYDAYAERSIVVLVESYCTWRCSKTQFALEVRRRVRLIIRA